MAKPKDPIYVWAAADVNLPGTGRPNKSKPIDDLLAKGYDKGQKPAAEEFNYILNMSSAWVNWIVNEKFPELEAEIARLLAELENRINQQLAVIRQDIAQLKQDVADLRRYVDQKVQELKQEIQGVRNDLNKLRQDFDAAIAQVNGRIDDLEPRLVPIGAVIPWPGATVPNGWLECNGQVFNTGTNPKLYGVLGRNVVPDYRGLFLRGWAHGSGANDPDAGRALGSVQGDAIRNMTGYFPADIGQSGWIGRYVGGVFRDDGPLTSGDQGSRSGEVRKYSFDASREVPTAPENRPKNVAVMYIIKTDQAQSSGGNSPTAIVVSPDTITNRVGYTVKATASVLPASIAGQYPVSWSTQNGSVATVDGSGNIRLVGPGETNIIASISTGMNVAIRVTSYSVLTSISIADPGQIPVTESKMLVVTKNPGGANEPLQFLSNNSGVATVNDAGYVTGVSPGSATITVRGTLSGVSSTRSVTIIPEQVEESVQDNRLGAVGSYIPPGNEISWTFQAPQGCALTGIIVQDTGSNSGDNIGGVYYKPIQKKVNGVWVTITG
ncbi:tail fiber protein; Ig-domain containing [Cronobacter phage CR8]|uniref:Putative tail fiber protein 1 n=1 Tax=Cronobacter phage CR8 TaxID=1327934 RepID=A0A060AM57_9CAUD|nr:tail fiber protein; Ig-domain containing [Cronobacter phage CR8]AIA64558.1 putative tail fiber protein 1 [Cronobacter phage CR8]